MPGKRIPNLDSLKMRQQTSNSDPQRPRRRTVTFDDDDKTSQAAELKTDIFESDATKRNQADSDEEIMKKKVKNGASPLSEDDDLTFQSPLYSSPDK